MKLIYSQIKYIACFALVFGAMHSVKAQCPAQSTQVCVTYTSGSFNNENSWLLYDATNGVELACDGTNPFIGTTTACVPSGNTVQLYAYETFGDNWNGATISMSICEDGSANGCDPQNTLLLAPVGGAAAADGNGTAPCGTNTVAGGNLLVTSTVNQMGAGCIECLTCPADIVVDNDPGVCGAFVDVPLPTDNGCGLGGVAINCSTIDGPAVPLLFNFTGLITTPFSIPGVSPISPNATCVSEVCMNVTMIADIGGAGFEQTNILGEDGSIIGQNATSAGDCNLDGGTAEICVPVDSWNTWAADGTVSLSIVTDADIDDICVAQATIQASVEICADCQIFANNVNMMGSAAGDYPIGTTPVTYTSSLNGNPISCSFSVTVNDTEAPTMTCPSNQTISLDAGECSAVFYYDILVEDNCPSAPFGIDGPFCNPCDDPSGGSALACAPFAQNSIIQPISTGGANGEITQVCYNQETFGQQPLATFNFYEDDGSGVVPYDDGAGTFAGLLLGSEQYQTLNANNGTCVCVDLETPIAINSSIQNVWVEVFTPGNTLNSRIVNTPATCNGNTATGTNTWINAPACGLTPPMTFASVGFILDASYSLTIQTGEIEAVPDPSNSWVSGDALPIGEHCFTYTSQDNSGNMAECTWCVTVNEFPRASQTRTLSCNDLVNISVDESCNAIITPDVILEGGPYGCYELYNVTIEGIPAGALNGNGNEIVTIDAQSIPAFAANGMAGTYEVSISDPRNSNNSCWGYIMLEDKLAPTITCEDVTISCISSTEPAFPTNGSSMAENTVGAQWSDATTGNVANPTAEVSTPAGSKITDVNVSVSLDHSWSGDLTVNLISPEGTVVNLATAQCGIDDNWNVTFDDDAMGGIACSGCATTAAPHENCNDPALNETCATISGTVQPQGSLADFIGEAGSGDWTLEINDNVGGDGGCLHGFSLEVAYQIGAATPAVAMDNCSQITPVYSDVVIDQDCTTGIDKVIFRQWAASDAKGNAAPGCIQEIVVEAIGLDDIPLPQPVVELPCGSDITPEAIEAFYDDPNTKDDGLTVIIENNEGTPWAFPYYFAGPHAQRLPDGGLCGVFADYKDHEINACGAHCHGNKKVIRTWTLLNWCNGEFDEYIQIIKAKDTDAPTFILKDTVVSTRPWDCTAEFMLPEPWELHDECDIDPSYYVSGPAGVVITPKPGGGFMASGAPKGKHIFYYTAYDCCGNERTQATQIAVLDKVSPVVTTDQDVVVSLTPGGPGADGQAKLFTYHFDNGSFDVCTDVHLEVRRADGAPDCGNIGDNDYNNNLTFNNTDVRFATGNHPNDNRSDTDGGEFVKFCCEDIDAIEVDANGDGVVDSLDRGYVMVILRVWDDANMSGVYGDEVAPFPDCAPQRDNYNEGWVFVKVEDKLPPIIACPDDATIYCDWGIDVSSDFGGGFQNADQANFDKTGRAEAYSTCGAVDVFFNDNVNVDDCGVGTIIRQWQASTESKTGPKVVTCQQIITVLPRPTQFMVTPPNPTPLVVGCTLTQDDLNKRLPTVTGGACDVIGENVKVDTFLFENGVCKKWRAEYNYYNWCTQEEMGPFYAYFVYEDTEDPVLDDCEDKMFGVDANCEHVLTLTNSATDGGGCVDNGWLKWQLFVDTWADGTINHYASSFVSSSTYRNWTPVAGNDPLLPGGNTYAPLVYVKYVEPTSSMGNDEVSITLDAEVITGKMSNHKATWKVTDGCHNHVSCSYDIMVADKKAPTPYCVSLSSALMEDGTVELWAIDFNKGSFDNCSEQEDLLFTFNEMAGAFKDTIIRVGTRDYLVNADVPQYFDEDGFVDFDGDGVIYPAAKTSTVNQYNQGDIQKWVPEYKSSAKVFDCDEYNSQGPNGVAVRMSVWDKKCNTDFCIVYLTLVDNQGACTPGTRLGIAGSVSTEAGDDLADVTVTLEGSVNDLVRVQTVNGAFEFDNLPEFVDYALTAEKDVDYMNGISTLDLVLIQRHILGLQSLDSSSKLIAADVNNDMNIRANDLVELRKLILGVTDNFTATSWKLVDADEAVSMNTPLVYSEIVNVDNLTANVTNANFTAIKVGDINGNAAANARSNNSEPRSAKTIHLQANEQEVVAGNTVSVEITSANFNNVFGYQFTTELNGLTLNGVRSGAIEMTDANVGLPKAGVLTTSWASENLANVAAGEVLFTLDFVATKSGKLSSMMNLNSSVTKAESYTGAELNVSDIDLSFRSENVEVANYALYQNEPNPFKDVTSVTYEMAEAGQAKFTLYDVTGKVLVIKNEQAVKGLNTVEFNAGEIKASGIVYYQIESGDFTATKKMIIIE